MQKRHTPKCQVCGCPVDGSARSYQQHKRFFALIKAYFEHWPESHSFQPDCEEHLRAWVLVKAKHRNVVDVVPGGRATTEARYSWRISSKGHEWLVWPMSISYDALPHKAACAVFNEVEVLLEAHTGIAPDKLLKEIEAAA